MAMTRLPPSQSQVGTSFGRSFYGIFTKFFPEGELDGNYDVEEDDVSQPPSPVVQPHLVAQPPVVHQPQKAPPQTFHQVQMTPPQTFHIDSEAPSFVCEPQEAESIYITAHSVAVNARSELPITSYGPAPADLSSFHRTSFTREQLQFRQQQLQVAEQQQQHQMRQQELHHRGREQHQNHAPQHHLAHQRQLEHQHQAQERQLVQSRPNQDKPKAKSEDAQQLTVGELLDQHVAYYLSQHPDIAASRRVLRKRAGCYEINGKDVKLDWEHDDPNSGQGYLVVIDGHSRQAFSEYVRKGYAKADPRKEAIQNTNLRAAQRDTRQPDSAIERYEQSKMEAMRIAHAPSPQPTSSPSPHPPRKEAIQNTNLSAAQKDTRLQDTAIQLYEQSKIEAVRIAHAFSPQPIYTPSPHPVYTAAPAVYNSGVYNSGIYSSGVYGSGVFTSQLALR